MNHIKALAIANSMNQDRLDAAARRRYARQPAKPMSAPRRLHLLEAIRASLARFRPAHAKAQPSR